MRLPPPKRKQESPKKSCNRLCKFSETEATFAIVCKSGSAILSHPNTGSTGDAHHRQAPGVLIGDFLPLLVPPGRTPMAGFHLDFRHGVHTGMLQPGQPFHRLHIQHADVVHGCGNENFRKNGSSFVIFTIWRILVWRVRLHIRVHIRVVQRIAPLVPFGDGQRQRRIKDRGQRVHERHIRLHARIAFRSHVGDRPHQ